MITIAGLGMVILMYLHWVNHISTTISAVTKNEAVDNAMSRVSEAFGSDEKYCNFILSNKGLNLSMLSSSGPAVSRIDFHNGSGDILTNILQRNAALPGNSEVTVGDIRLRPIAQVDALNFVASLDITFVKKVGSSSAVAIPMIRRLPIFATVKTSSGEVENCTASGNNKISLEDRLCEMNFDGFASYDPNTKECKDIAGVEWFSGPDAFSASCPAGYLVAVAKNGPKRADVACASSGFADFVLPPRTYLSGTVLERKTSRAWVPSLEVSTSTCNFTYMLGFSTTGVKAKIKCFKLATN